MVTASHSSQPHVPDAVAAWLRSAGHGEIVTTTTPLSGGTLSAVARIRTTAGAAVVLKQCAQLLPPDVYPLEAQGLQTLAEAGCLRTPAVLMVDAKFLLLEDLGTHPATASSWAALGRGLAYQHLVTNDRFGFGNDNYLGRVAQRNTWLADGHEFFAEHRILRFLEIPACEQLLEPDDRRRLQRLADRLPDLIPAQPAALLHGDLWHENVLPAPDRPPALCDPAAYYGWPEAELSMLYGYCTVPDEFTTAYSEVRPLEDGWRDRLPILHVRELLAVLAHIGNIHGSREAIRNILDRFV